MLRRDAGIDALRIVAIAAVVFAHVWTDNDLVRAATYSWHVPVFFFLSGYFWSSPRSIGSELRTRWRTLAVPYLVWLVLITGAIALRTVLAGGTPGIDWGGLLLGGYRLGRPYTTFWFVSALFIAAIVYRLMQRLPLWAQCGIAVVVYGAVLALPEIARAIPLAGGTAIGSLVFMVAGTIFHRYRHLIPTPLAFAAAGILVSALLLWLRISTPLDLKQANFGTPVLSVLVALAICASLVILCDEAFRNVSDRVGRVIVLVASAGLFVVLTHPVILWLLGTGPEGSWSAFALALTVPWGVGLIVVFTPLSQWFAGVPRRRRVDSHGANP